MPRPSSSSSYLDGLIEGETKIHRFTEAMPYGGYKNTRVREKAITLAKVPPRRTPENDPDT